MNRTASRVVPALSALATIGLAVTTAACGGSPAGQGVASLGSTTTTVAAGGSQTNNAALYSKAVAYAQCMRTHGEPNMPDPNSKGQFLSVRGKLNGVSGLDANSSRFAASDKQCRHLLPNGGQPTAAQRQQLIAQALKFVQCMRTHGVPNMPDPDTSGGSISIRPPAGMGPGSTAFVRAQRECRSSLPGP